MMQNKKIAITGGIGSGKTVLCELLRSRGYPVFSCDEISARLWTQDEYLRDLAAAFPDCCSGGAIDKGKLTQKVFSDGNARIRLNGVAHPIILQTLFSEMAKHPTCFAEVPLLFEEGLEPLFDGAIALRRPTEQRVAAVRARDGLSEAEIDARIAAQFDAAQLESKGCFIVENDGTRAALEAGADAALAHFGIR